MRTATSAAATTRMSGPGSASASAACGSTGPSPSRSWRPCPSGPSMRRCSRPSRPREAADEFGGRLRRELEEARYEASLAERRYEHVDPAKRHVARELEARWNAALERVVALEQRLAPTGGGRRCPAQDRSRGPVAPGPRPAGAWNAPRRMPAPSSGSTRIADRGGRHRPRRPHQRSRGPDPLDRRAAHRGAGRAVRSGRYPADRNPSAVEVIRKLGGQWPDRELAVTMNRMRCKTPDGATWTTVRVRELRERLGIAPYDPAAQTVKTISVDETAQRLGICVGSVHLLSGKACCRQPS